MFVELQKLAKWKLNKCLYGKYTYLLRMNMNVFLISRIRLNLSKLENMMGKMAVAKAPRRQETVGLRI